MYNLIGKIDDIALLAPPFDLSPVTQEHDRVWLNRGLPVNRFTGEIVYLTQAIGFGEGEFGTAYFGWS